MFHNKEMCYFVSELGNRMRIISKEIIKQSVVKRHKCGDWYRKDWNEEIHSIYLKSKLMDYIYILLLIIMFELINKW